jgi:hypothetical protein
MGNWTLQLLHNPSWIENKGSSTVETTTIEEAVESLILAPPDDAQEAQADNPSEVEGDVSEAPDDGQTEEIEAATESKDDVGASDELDAEIDADDLADDEVETPTLYPVKVDGKDEAWTIDQLKQSAAGQAAINKRFQEIAQERKQIEQYYTALQQERQQVMQLYQNGQQGGTQPPVAPSKELFDQDPIGFMEAKLQYDDAKAAYDQNARQVEYMRQQDAQQQAQARQGYLREQARVLQEHIPEFGDPEKAANLKGKLTQIGMEYGFTAEEMEVVSDARYVRALNDARKYRELVSKRKQAQQKGQAARPVVKAGAKKTADPIAVDRKKAQSRLKQSGSINDALGLILDT